MDYIVNPNFIYLLQVVDNARTLMLIIGIVLCAILWWVIIMFDYDILNEKFKNIKRTIKYVIVTNTIGLIFILGYIFTPSKETLIAMEISKNVTYTNINKAKKEITKTIDYIFDKIKTFKD